MSYESTAAPIKIGYLMDLRLPAFYPQEMRDDLTRSLELVFSEGVQQKIIDRPVEIAFREVEGLPKGTVKAVIDAFGELVDEGCAPPAAAAAAAGRAALRRRRGSRRRPRPREPAHDVATQASGGEQRRLHGERLDLLPRGRGGVDEDHPPIRPGRLAGFARRRSQLAPRDLADRFVAF
jgi:hypothetical protein